MSAYRVSAHVTDEELARKTRGLVRFARTPAGLLLHWRWVSRLAVQWVVGFLLFGGFLIALVRQAHPRSDSVFSGPFFFCALCVLGFGYVAAAHLVNQTRVVVSEQSIAVAHGPIPWPGRKTVPLAHVAQLFVKREFSGRKGRRTVDYRVMVADANGRKSLLVNAPMQPSRARAIEAVIEAYLQLEDRPVKGEF